jgi:ribosomal protein S18 acetylase RimI-like enzyme
VRVRRLDGDDVTLVAAIDRSEHVDVEYCVRDGQLVERPVSMAEIPPWDQSGDGPHSVSAHIDFCARAIAGGGVLLGCYDEERAIGVAVIDPSYDGPLAWLAFLHVNRSDRRRGAATRLWDEATAIARADGAGRMYVSATPTGSAVGFYLRQGCVLADPVHPALFELEPHDVHLVLPLG